MQNKSQNLSKSLRFYLQSGLKVLYCTDLKGKVAPIAQLVEQEAFNFKVIGSSPIEGIYKL